MAHFNNTIKQGDWVVHCDVCGRPDWASKSQFKSAGLNDKSVLCCDRCAKIYNPNIGHIKPIPVYEDNKAPPFVRPGFDSDFSDITPPFDPFPE